MSVQSQLLAFSEAELSRDIAMEQAFLNGTPVLAPITEWLEENGYATRPNYEGSHSGDTGDEPEASGPLPQRWTWYEDGAGI